MTKLSILKTDASDESNDINNNNNNNSNKNSHNNNHNNYDDKHGHTNSDIICNDGLNDVCSPNSLMEKKNLALRKVKNQSIALPSPKLNKRYKFSILPSVKYVSLFACSPFCCLFQEFKRIYCVL